MTARVPSVTLQTPLGNGLALAVLFAWQGDRYGHAIQLVGPDLVRRLRPEIGVPLVGIGGITLDNVAEVIRAGAAPPSNNCTASLAWALWHPWPAWGWPGPATGP